jgi:hypothetical protein
MSCKVQLVKQRKTSAVKAKTEVIDMYDIPSSQGTTPSPVLVAAGSVIGGAVIKSRTVGLG